MGAARWSVLGFAAAALAAAGLAACSATDERSAASRVEGPGNPAPKALDVYEVWEWRVETGRLSGPVPAPAETFRAGLRVAVTRDAGLPGFADAHQVAEGVPVAIPVGEGRWPAGGWASPATADPIWADAQVRVSWQVTIRRRGTCAADVEAVPLLVHPTGCVALLHDLAVRRVVGLEEALVIGTDSAAAPTGADPMARAARLLGGGGGTRGGGPGRVVFRLRE